MNRIRDWGFPAALMFAWTVATSYTLTLMMMA